MNVFLLLGSNLGNRLAALQEARALLSAQVGAVVGQSGYYESEPWGFEAPTWFINQALHIETHLTPLVLLHTIQHIEQQLGRVRATPPGVYASRPIDIDILFYGNDIIHTPALTVPHPALHQRRFALLPLCDIAPGHIHPVLHKTTAELLQQCDDQGTVRKL
ncbi:MAG: 2-amino-4-hydroxy-6-hydroxymethyldihydropteridine diphosphokinase [Prevotellaceae bacterium]|jgi:2-amino-4-hydroxy-6-hydroxymethyldihydropteridine diphosphokinase|nr:2-amino-4-hydroxy-6-hydroxymethyldihydropteridine diphosphokinase [Prevotellaceae bacterium]